MKTGDIIITDCWQCEKGTKQIIISNEESECCECYALNSIDSNLVDEKEVGGGRDLNFVVMNAKNNSKYLSHVIQMTGCFV